MKRRPNGLSDIEIVEWVLLHKVKRKQCDDRHRDSTSNRHVS